MKTNEIILLLALIFQVLAYLDHRYKKNKLSS